MLASIAMNCKRCHPFINLRPHSLMLFCWVLLNFLFKWFPLKRLQPDPPGNECSASDGVQHLSLSCLMIALSLMSFAYILLMLPFLGGKDLNQ